jgi:hypothetical protein
MKDLIAKRVDKNNIKKTIVREWFCLKKHSPTLTHFETLNHENNAYLQNEWQLWTDLDL